MNPNWLFIRLGQCICIALIAYWHGFAHAQSKWQITDTAPANHQYSLYALDCKGAWCIACFQDGFVDGVEYYSQLKLKQSFDFGRTWTEYDPKFSVPENNHNMSVEIIDSEDAIALIDLTTILRTSDRGATWKQAPTPDSGYYYAISFSDPLHGMLMGNYHCSTTSDGGDTWHNSYFSQVLRYCHAFGDGKFSAFDLEGHGKIYTTSNSWVTYDSGEAPRRYAEDSAHVFVWGKSEWLGGDTLIEMGNEKYTDTIAQMIDYHGILCFSYDGGKSWDTPYVDSSFLSFNNVSGYHGTTIYASSLRSEGRVRKSGDRGNTWLLDTTTFTSTPPGTGETFMIALSYAGDGTLIGAFDDSFLGDRNFMAYLISNPSSVRRCLASAPAFMYPNPASSFIRISRGGVSHVELHDLLGRTALSQEPREGSIDVSSIPPGIYEVLLYSAGQAATPSVDKIVVAK